MEVSNTIRGIASGIYDGTVSISDVSGLLMLAARDIDKCIDNHVGVEPKSIADVWKPFGKENDNQDNTFVTYNGELCVYVPDLEAEPIKVMR